MNPILTKESFWRPYLTLDVSELSEEDVAEQLNGLSDEYEVRDKVVRWELDGVEQTATHRVVEFTFSCGDRFAIVLEYQPDAYGCAKNLFLVETATGAKHEMGWWDEARWHPYCLHINELDSLLRYWSRWDPGWPSEELPLLLLCQFVGLCDSRTNDRLSMRAEAAYRLVVPSAVEQAEPAVPLGFRDDYRWDLDSELGWVFTSDEYCCYSIRNCPHADSNEGAFPFRPFGDMMLEIHRHLGDPR